MKTSTPAVHAWGIAMLNAEDFVADSRPLFGLKQIGEYLGLHRNTVSRWIREYHLPAMRCPDGRYCTTPRLIDRWILVRCELEAKARQGESDMDSASL